MLTDWLLYNPQKPLLFTRPAFWIYFLLVFAVFSLIYKKTFWRNTWLFVVSVFFYYKSSGLFFFLIIASVIINYLIGKRIYNTSQLTRKKGWVAMYYKFVSQLNN